MNIQVFTYAINGILMIGMPVALAIFITRRWRLGWRIWWIGLTCFILSQVGHIPFNAWMGDLLNRTGLVYWPPVAQDIFNASFLGLSAGIFEEGARYLLLRYWAKDCRSWRKGLLFGAGHGGAEAIIVGVLALVSYGSMLVIRNIDLATIVPSEQLQMAEQQVIAYWSAPWYTTLLGSLERFFAIPIQLALTVMVLQAFLRNKPLWVVWAVLYHAIVDGIVVFLMPSIGIYWTEALVGGFSVLSVTIIYLLRQPEIKPEPESASVSPVPSLVIVPLDETKENLDNTRLQN